MAYAYISSLFIVMLHAEGHGKKFVVVAAYD